MTSPSTVSLLYTCCLHTSQVTKLSSNPQVSFTICRWTDEDNHRVFVEIPAEMLPIHAIKDASFNDFDAWCILTKNNAASAKGVKWAILARGNLMCHFMPWKGKRFKDWLAIWILQIGMDLGIDNYYCKIGQWIFFWKIINFYPYS